MNLKKLTIINFDILLEFLFHKSSELTLIIANEIFSENNLPENINHPTFGSLSIHSQMIDYPIIFE